MQLSDQPKIKWNATDGTYLFESYILLASRFMKEFMKNHSQLVLNLAHVRYVK